MFLELLGLGDKRELWITKSLGLSYGNVLGIMLGNVGGGITKPKSFWNLFVEGA